MVITRHDRKHEDRIYTTVYHPEINPYEEEKVNKWSEKKHNRTSLIDRSRIRPTNIYYWFLKNFHITRDNIKLKRHELIRRIRKRLQKEEN